MLHQYQETMVTNPLRARLYVPWFRAPPPLPPPVSNACKYTLHEINGSTDTQLQKGTVKLTNNFEAFRNQRKMSNMTFDIL
jgi:hypothetical protein